MRTNLCKVFYTYMKRVIKPSGIIFYIIFTSPIASEQEKLKAIHQGCHQLFQHCARHQATSKILDCLYLFSEEELRSKDHKLEVHNCPHYYKRPLYYDVHFVPC